MLAATDIAGRGLDNPLMKGAVNFDLPEQKEDILFYAAAKPKVMGMKWRKGWESKSPPLTAEHQTRNEQQQ